MRLNDCDAVVVGAGIGGAATALLLAAAGASVTALERVAKPGAVGAGLLLQPNGLAVLDGLGLAGQLAARGSYLSAPALRSAAGTVLADLRPPAYEAVGLDRLLAVHRADLHALLLTALQEQPRITVYTGALVTAARPDGTVELLRHDRADTISADLVVGADGIRSVVRSGGGFASRLTGIGGAGRAGSGRRRPGGADGGRPVPGVPAGGRTGRPDGAGSAARPRRPRLAPGRPRDACPLLPLAWFAYRRSGWGIAATLVALSTSMAWFPAPAQPDPRVQEFRDFERRWLTGDWDAGKVLLTLLVPLSLTAYCMAFWKRSLGWGLVILNAMTGGKLMWGVIAGDGTGWAMTAPALAGLLIGDLIVLSFVRRARASGSPADRAEARAGLVPGDG